MLKASYKDHLFVSKLFVLLSLFLVGFGLSTVLALLGVQYIFGIDVLNNPSILSDFTQTGNISSLKFVQLLNSLGLFVFPPLMFAYMVSQDQKKYLGIKSNQNPLFPILTIAIMIASLPLINFLIDLNAKMSLPEFLGGVESWMREKEDSAEVITKSFLHMESFPSYLLNLLVIAIVPAIGEELLFRGLIQNKISQSLKNYHAGIWISAFLFSAMHMQFYGFIPRFLLGGVFGYLFVWSGALWIPILAHLINNAGAVTMHYVLGSSYTEEHIDTFGAEGDTPFLFGSIILLGVFLYYAHRFSVSKETSSD